MTRDIDALVARFAAPPVTEVSEGARELMHDIMSTAEPAPRRTRRRLSLRVAIPAGALLTAAVLAMSWLLPTSSAVALDIKREGGYYIIAIKDLYADPESYETQLRAVGLNISLRVIPTTPALEGSVFPTSPDKRHLPEIQGINPPGQCGKMDGCAIGVKIPVGFKGTAHIDVGRKARPGERYESTTSFDAKGEPMHCVPYYNKSVAEVRAMLRERGVSIEEFIVTDPDSKDARDYDVADSVPDSWLVHGGTLNEPGSATIVVHEKPMPQKNIDNLNAANGCPSS
ncbi:hypothetical protein [Nonomuraea sp. SYSU D8015]|uniref:hypothetical protein n=1 Tax=Nonomuraea sp. SYSU D8015 TaxID=2593644 RepID=UPI0016612E80|nr:hypothetical protein [Nonomuraea sp. SYSU D8015]